MIIDKVAPFYTEKERIALAEYNKRWEALSLEDEELLKKIRAAAAADNDEAFEYLNRSREILDEKLRDAIADKNTLKDAAQQRYAESFNGNIEAIMKDAREIISAVEKKDYLAYQKALTDDIKPFLENFGKPGTKEEKIAYRSAKHLATRGYYNCCQFIFGQIFDQINALNFYGKGSKSIELAELADEKATSFYSRPKGANTFVDFFKEEYAEPKTITREAYHERSLPVRKGAEVRGDFMAVPGSPILTTISDILSGMDLTKLPDRKRKYNRNISLLVEEHGDKRRISYTKDKTAVSVEIDDFRKIVNRNPQTKKILTRILVRANEQAIHNGELTRDRVSFPLSELVGEGQYKNLDTARRGFHNVADTLTGLKVSGIIERGKKKTLQQSVHAVLFKAIKVDNATCEVYLNELLNWGVIAPYYTGLPDYYFELPDRAAELLEYIFYLARQNTRQIAEQGSFYIGYRAIQYRLNLPNEIQDGKPINNPKRDIKDPIENAIEQIEEKYCKYAPPIPADATGKDAEPDFSLLPLADYDAPIKEYLDSGKLKISLKGEYAKRFIAMSNQTAAKLEAARKRREKIEDHALAINLAKSKEADKK